MKHTPHIVLMLQRKISKIADKYFKDIGNIAFTHLIPDEHKPHMIQNELNHSLLHNDNKTKLEWYGENIKNEIKDQPYYLNGGKEKFKVVDFEVFKITFK